MTSDIEQKCIQALHSQELYIDRKITVTDDWYPCYPNNQVDVSIDAGANYDGSYTVCVKAYGLDDFGVSLEKVSNCPTEVYALYIHWKKWIFDRIPDGITVEWFFEHGFYYD